jgi:hypothetical protein
LVSVLARLNELDEAVKQYKETEHIIKNDKNCVDRQNSVEFLRIAGCEIVLISSLNKRKEVYEKLDSLPQVFNNNDFPKAYHNQMFIHYKYLIEKSLGNLKTDDVTRRDFYLFLSEQVADSVTRNKITLVTMIQLAMILSYIYVFKLKNSSEHKKLIENLICEFSANPSFHFYSKIHSSSREMYEILKDGKVPNRNQLIKFIEETMYMIGKI